MNLIVKDDKLQKYRDHIQVNAALSAKDKELYDRFFFAFTQLLDGLSERKVVELLMNCPAPIGQLSQSQAYNTVNGAQEIFGVLNFSNSKKMAQRYIYATRLEEMAAKVEELAHTMVNKTLKTYYDEDGYPVAFADPAAEKEAAIMLDKASNMLMKAGKIKGLTEKDKFENPNKYKVAPNVIFTDDMSALELLREIEDTEFENVAGDGAETEEGTTETDSAEG